MDNSTNTSDPLWDKTTSSDDDDSVSERVLFLQRVNLNCWKFISPTLLIVGTVGNIVSIMVLRRYVHFHQSSSID